MLDEKFIKAMEEVMTEKTFNLEIVGKIHTMKTEYERALRELTEANARNGALNEAVKLSERVATEASGKLAEACKELEIYRQREKNIMSHELHSTYQTLRGNEFKEIIMGIVRSPIFKRTMSGYDSAIVQPNQYNSCPQEKQLPKSEATTESIE